MKSLLPLRFFGRVSKAFPDPPVLSQDAATTEVTAHKLRVAGTIHPVAQAALEQWRSRRATLSNGTEDHGNALLTTLGWVSAAVGTLAFGLVVGRELRRRYKFTRRTPYDFYAHSGDERDLEFGVGV